MCASHIYWVYDGLVGSTKVFGFKFIVILMLSVSDSRLWNCSRLVYGIANMVGIQGNLIDGVMRN